MNRKGNLILTFVVLVALAALIATFIFTLTGRTKNTGDERLRSRAFYIADAGVNKALWYLSTPTGLGGKGNSWRASGFTESYSGGNYSFSILDLSENTFRIISTGEINSTKVTVIQNMRSSSLPAAFTYALYSNGNLELKSSTIIKGDVFSNGNIDIEKTDNHPTGEAFVSSGHTVNGTPGNVPDPLPAMPTLNSTYYDSMLAQANAAPTGNQTLNDTHLDGATILVNGDATLSGNITGGGTIVVTGNTDITGATLSPDTKIICNGEIDVQSTTSIQDRGVLYSPTKISIPGNSRLNGSVMSASISINGTPTIYGILYSWSLGVDLKGTVNVYGSIVNPTSTLYDGNISIEYDPDYLPPAPPGLAAGGFTTTKGSWKGY